jgi:hypothetical protein
MVSMAPEERISVYLGERYLPGASPEQVMAAVERVRTAVADLARDGSPVRLLSTTFVPKEEWLFDLFEAGAAAEVERIYALADVMANRVAEAVHMVVQTPAEGGVPGRWR